jgi:DNA sulfur modification protein DndC
VFGAIMLINKLEDTIETLSALLVKNHVLTIGLSGKDSACVVHCAVEALKRAQAENPNAGPVIVNTINTTQDNFELIDFLRGCHLDIEEYAAEHGLPVECVELIPPVHQRPFVQYCGSRRASYACA